MLDSTWRGSPQEQIWTQLIRSQIQAGRRPVAYHYLFHAGEAACCLPLPLSCWRGGLLPTTTSFMLERRPVTYHYLFHVGEAACYLPLPLSCWRGGLLPTTTSFMLERRPVAYHYLFHERQPTGRRDLDRINQKSDFITLKYR